MNPRTRRTGLLAAIVTVAVAGCSAAAPNPTPAASSATPVAPASSRADLPTGDQPVTLDPAEFTADITHPYWPMAPGTQWTYRERDGMGGELQVTITATDQTRMIANGITARVVRDTVRDNGAIVEDTFDWYAQDTAGNVWYLGEDTAEFENGQVSSTKGSFEAGVDGALPGILLPTDPQPGLAYRQEYYQGEAEDNGEVLSTAEMAEVPYGQFTGVLLTKDTITIEPTVQQFKMYAEDVGPVLVLGVSGGSDREELLSVVKVPPGTGTGPLGAP
jgi:hypothetical protein